MKQIKKYLVKHLTTDKIETFNSLDEAKERTKYIRHLGLGALIYCQTSSLYGDNTTLVEF